MKKRFASLIIALVMVSALITAASAADTFVPVTGRDMLNNIMLGINIGNTLEAHPVDNVLSGLETESYWGEAKITPEHFKAIALKGFTSVRIPITWEPHMDGNHIIDKAWMDRVRQCVDWALDAGLYVIINAHHEEKFYKLLDSDPAKAGEELTVIWGQVAEEFKDYPEKLIFEPMNEPNNGTQGNWVWDYFDANGGHVDRKLADTVNQLNLTALELIRKSGGHNDKRVVMLTVPGANAGAIELYQEPDDLYTMLGVFIYPGDDIANVKAAVDKGISVVVKEISPIGKGWDGEAAKQLEWTKASYNALADMGVPAFWWNCGELSTSPLLFDRFTYSWPNAALLDAVFAAYGETPGDDLTVDLPPLFPYELDVPSKDGEFTFWNTPWGIKDRMNKLVIEVDGKLNGGYAFARFYPSDWLQFDKGDKRITEVDGTIIFDLSGLEGSIVGFAAWGEGDSQKIKRVYLDGENPSPDPLSTATEWAKVHITRALDLELIPQNLQVNYQKPATRAEFCALAVALIESITGEEITARKEFTDTTDINVQKIGGMGIVTGTNAAAGTFSPNATIKREDAAVILAKLMNKMGKPLEEKTSTFADIGTASGYAVTAIGQMELSRIMTGSNGAFSPKGDYSIEMCITTILKAYDLLK